jgi:hypothetical protein
MTPPDMPGAPGAPVAGTLPVRRILLWSIIGLAIVAGLVLYFRYERTLTPLVG